MTKPSDWDTRNVLWRNIAIEMPETSNDDIYLVIEKPETSYDET